MKQLKLEKSIYGRFCLWWGFFAFCRMRLMSVTLAVCLLTMGTPHAGRAADVQVVKMGNDTLYVPREWVTRQWFLL